MNRNAMKLPPCTPERGDLRDAVSSYLGVYPKVGQPMPEAYARILNAIANEIEQMEREGKIIIRSTIEVFPD